MGERILIVDCEVRRITSYFALSFKEIIYV